MILSGTSPPFSTISFAFKPTSVPSLICERRTSPLERWVTENVLTILSETVPLPDPGGPMIRARTGFDDILERWILRTCFTIVGVYRNLRIKRRLRVSCIVKIWNVFKRKFRVDWVWKTFCWHNKLRAREMARAWFKMADVNEKKRYGYVRGFCLIFSDFVILMITQSINRI